MREWTKQQLKAIETVPNLLVSAAAGSGKTAVLVERITRMLIPDTQGYYVPIDRLLVVTFARDAAREMQQRIKLSLEAAYANEKQKSKKKILKQQLRMLPFAEFSTIDSFCMRFVKQNFHLLGIDPRFKIFDNTEADVFTAECMEEYFDLLYENKDHNFLLLTSLYSKGYDDREVMALITSVYKYTRALADPNSWLVAHADDYAGFSKSVFCQMIEANFKEVAGACLSGLKKLLSDYDAESRRLFGDEAKTEVSSAIEGDISLLSSAAYDWDSIYLIKDKFANLKKSNSKKAEEVFQKQYIDYREAILDPIRKIMAFVKDTAQNLDSLYNQTLHPHAVAIAQITCGFADFIFDKKNKAGKFEFNDLEHMTRDLLKSNDAIRNSYIQKYEEILMDEYQDTNGLQEEIFNLISTGSNRFMVGDLKQSIYGFRNSDPMIFSKKDQSYSKSGADGSKVVLSGNFRSREEVLESINDLFEKIMSSQMGGVEYDQDQALHYLNKQFENKHQSNCYTSELYVIEGAPNTDDEDLLSDEETEANFVADKIKEMIDNRWQVFDKGEFRDICQTDFAIIMNAVKSDSSIYINALRERGLNGYSEDRDFLDKTEIKLITSFVKAVNNPMRDIPLVSVMRSPVYRFTDEELAQIRISSKGQFWKSVLIRAHKDDDLGIKCKKFAQQINKWRDMSKHMSADRLIWRLMTDCSLYDMCGILYGGEVASANLRLYMERAKALSDGGIATLYDFEVYMDRLAGSEGLSSALSSTDGVPVMTIHKSKGLEFPVVFLCRTGKKFVLDGYSGAVNIHKDLGFGLNYINTQKSYTIPTVNRKIIGAAKNRESMSEQLRKLYVAMTRAKEKLIVTGVVHSTKQKSAFEFADAQNSHEHIESSKSFVHMIAPVIKNSNSKWWSYNEVEAGIIENNPTPVSSSKTTDYDQELVNKQIYDLFDKYYRIPKAVGVPAKISVSELKNKSGVSSKLQRLPEFMNAQETMGAAFGTAVHQVMEQISILPQMTKEHISLEVQRITGEANDKIEDKIYDFFQSRIGKRVCKGKVSREEAFEIQIPAFDKEGNELENEYMLLQGVIDMFFEDDNNLVLVDYKTDKCNQISELAEKYGIQLKWYKLAMEKLLNRKVDEVYIYSFHHNSYIEISEMIK